MKGEGILIFKKLRERRRKEEEYKTYMRCAIKKIEERLDVLEERQNQLSASGNDSKTVTTAQLVDEWVNGENGGNADE